VRAVAPSAGMRRFSTTCVAGCPFRMSRLLIRGRSSAFFGPAP
jgi:hypothetical protein